MSGEFAPVAPTPDGSHPVGPVNEGQGDMGAARRRKLSAVTGVVAMIVGALLVLAPAGAGADAPGNNGTVKLDGLDLFDGPGHSGQPNDPDETDPDNDPHLDCGLQLEFFGFDEGQTADITFTTHPPTGAGGVLLQELDVEISGDPQGGGPNDPDVVRDYAVLDDFDLTQFTSVHAVHGWHVKLALTLYDADGKEVPGGKKHKTFWLEECIPVEPGTGALSVDKVVTGTAPPAADTAFGFTVDCVHEAEPVDLNGDDAGTQAAFTLTAAELAEVLSGLPDGATCTITETVAHGANPTSITVDGGTPTAGVTVSGVTIEAGETRVVVVTNAFSSTPFVPGGSGVTTTTTTTAPPVPASLEVVKVVAGSDAPETWSFDFTMEGGSDEAAFELTDADSTALFGGLDASTYRITETLDPSATLTDVTCLDGADELAVELTGGSAFVDLAEGADAVCTFTNTFPDVAPSEVTTTSPPTTAQVLGDVVTRTLPRTGDETRDLAALGGALLAVGAAMVLGSNRRLVKQG